MKKYKCIVVKSQTYAKKAEKVLSLNGISSSVLHCKAGSVSGCGRCVKVEEKDVDRSVDILKKECVILTGEIYGL